jgi:hypothetical protein
MGKTENSTAAAGSQKKTKAKKAGNETDDSLNVLIATLLPFPTTTLARV